MLRLAKRCPVDPAVERIISANNFNSSSSAASRHAVHAWARKAASLDTAERRASLSVERRANVLHKVMLYVTSRLTASFISEHADYRQALSAWILNAFRPECRLLPQAELKPLDEALVEHGLLIRRSRSRARTTTLPSSPFAQFRDLIGRCHVCYAPQPQLVCSCGTGRCTACFGAKSPPPFQAFRLSLIHISEPTRRS